ncbi:MAG: EAL domain-containing protein [Sideroxyarcus sp.]|nr:EAL domain-containing protein [Sideroxyarcus sp.]
MTHHAPRLRQAVFVAVALFVSAMLGITVYTLWRLHVAAITNGLEISEMHTRSFEDFLTQSLHASEMAAINTAPSKAETADLHNIGNTFVKNLQHAPQLRSISLLDNRGKIIASSNPANIGVNVATESYLPPTAGQQEILRIGQPWSGRDFADGSPSSDQTPVDTKALSFIPVAKTLIAGERGMMLLFALNPDYFINHISQELGADTGTVEVLRYDGTMLMNTDPDARIGSLHAYVVRDLKLSEVEAGRFEQDFGNGRRELTAYRSSRLYPFVVVTHIHPAYALRKWQTEAKILLAVVIPALLSICLLAVAYYRRQLQIAAQRAEAERLQRINATVFDSSAEGIIITDLNADIISVNPAFTRISGFSQEEVIGHNPRMLSSGQQSKTFYESMWKEILLNGFWQGELVNCHKDGSYYDVHLSISASLDSAGRLQHYIGVTTDVTGRKHTEHELRIAATAFESQEGILVTDADRNILRVNRAFTDITGYPAAEVIGKNPRLLSSGRHEAGFYADMWENLLVNGAWKGEIWNRRKNGEIYPERLTITAVENRNGAVINYVASLSDITLHKAAEEEIKTLAFFDPLTRLPNRRLLLDRLQQALASSSRSAKAGAILFIDLDNFKNLNDTLGHDIGDLLLQQVADRLESCVREGDTVARIGGDEFVVMLEGLSSELIEAASQTEIVGWKIIAALNQPYQLDKYEAHSTPSMGATLFDGRPQIIDDLFKQADIAMYQAKKSGRNTLRFFDPQMQDTLNIRAAVEGDLRKSIERGQFLLYYQIQVDDTRHPLGAEALIRWIHPERGLVSPDQFIPLAEETGLILPIGQWVLESACSQIKEWEKDPLTRDLILAVNVSAKQFHQTDFAARVLGTVQRFGIDPTRLKLELTESMLQDSIEDTIAIMITLKENGVRFSLDDFGTGYSSLQYIKRLPLDQLKIDKSFVRDLSVGSDDKAIVSAIIAMAKSLKLDVIAEGVETEEQRRMLLNKGCSHFQGYLFSKPVPIEQFEAELATTFR